MLFCGFRHNKGKRRSANLFRRAAQAVFRQALKTNNQHRNREKRDDFYRLDTVFSPISLTAPTEVSSAVKTTPSLNVSYKFVLDHLRSRLGHEKRAREIFSGNKQ